LQENRDFETDCESYLLGEFSEQEQAQFEEEYFRDDALFERFLAVNDDLVDSYARGQLAGRKLELFENHFLATERRRQHVKEARTFIDAVNAASDRKDDHQTQPAASPVTWWQSLSQRTGLPAFTLQAAFALLIILAIAIGWFWIRNVQNQRDEQRNLARDETQPTPSPARSVSPDNERVADNKPTPSPTVNPSPGNVNSRSPAPPQMATLTLVPFAPRDGNAANTLQISPETRTASLRLTFKGDGYSGYNVTLKTVEGRAVAQRNFSRAASSSSGKSLTFNVAASLLTGQDYIVSVNGITANRQSEALAEYFFRVAHPSKQ